MADSAANSVHQSMSFRTRAPLGWRRQATIRQQTQHPASQTVDKFQIRFNNRQNIRADDLITTSFPFDFNHAGMNLGDQAEASGLISKSSNHTSTGKPPIAA
ncbi:hypothetical protein ACLK19_25875 [Escherichia coli]